MIKYDYHLHTSFSSDSEAPMKDMIERAITLGLDGICFTEHYDYDFPANPENLDFLLDFVKYQNTLHLYKEEYQNKIEICHGIEVGVQPHIGTELQAFQKKYGDSYDFILASCHVVAGMDPYEPPYFETYAEKMGMQLYLETLHKNMKIYDGYQSLAHIDYAYRYYPAPRPEFSYNLYGDVLDEILRELISQGKALEVNTSGLRSGLPFPNPHLDILKRYREFGGELITIGSDAHKPLDLAHAFCNLGDYLDTAGFRYFTIYKQQKPYFIKF